MSAARIEAYEDFVKVHGVLLSASGLPRSLHRKLFKKLTDETFDGGAHFQIEHCDGGRQRRLVLISKSLDRESDVFLVDHAWTFRLADAYQQLKEVPGLAERMAALMCVDIDEDTDEEARDAGVEASGRKFYESSTVEDIERKIGLANENSLDSVTCLELDELGIDDQIFISLSLPDKFQGLVSLSLCNNKLKDAEVVVAEVTKFRNLKGLWLNNNQMLDGWDEKLENHINQICSELEILNSKFTRKFGKWALAFCGGMSEVDQSELRTQDVVSLDLSNRNIHSLVNKAFSPINFPSLSHVNLRGNPLDADSSLEQLQALKNFTCLRSLEVDIPGPLGDSATEILEFLPQVSMFNSANASKILESHKEIIDSALQPRLPEWKTCELLHDRVLNAMWLYIMTYRLADEVKIDETSLWYVMDELGSALRHSDEANFRVAPFLFMPEGKLDSAVSYSVLWPIQNVACGDECTRDFLKGVGEDKQRSARLTAYFHTPRNYFVREYEKFWQRLTPSEKLSWTSVVNTQCDNKVPLLVYTDIPQIQELLTRPEFMITSEIKDADIIWTSMQVDDDFKNAAELKDEQFINQFPFEASIVMKHHLAMTIQKAYGSPEWLQPTYNLESQLSALIGDYYVRDENGRDNLWILKPWNMARTIDTTVTDNLSAIIRLMETGPKICQKYIEKPALFNGKKFDIRYIVLVRSMNPLQIFLADVFWVRLANNQYTLEKNSFFEYETHFTVMNYRGILNHKNTDEFIAEFEQEHQVLWSDIHQRVRTMIRSVFEGAASVHPEMQSPMSRAIYGVDVMLDDAFKPKLLEVTYCPDCTRAYTYDFKPILGAKQEIRGREFFNYIFGCLFLGEDNNVTPL